MKTKAKIINILKNGEYLLGIELIVSIEYYGFFCVIKYFYPIEEMSEK